MNHFIDFPHKSSVAKTQNLKLSSFGSARAKISKITAETINTKNRASYPTLL